MGDTKDKIIRFIFEVWDESNLPSTTMATIHSVTLVGRGSEIDSLTFVSFIVAVEQKVGDAFGQKITLANSRAFSQTQNPFETIDSLASYIEELIDGE